MQHSWNWLAARLSPRRIWNSTSASPHRPCLPSIEQLGDRVMLSADSAIDGLPTGDSAVLAAVIKGELPLITTEQDLLNLAGGGMTDKTADAFHKITDAFLKINDTLYKAVDDAFKLDDIKGESQDDKHKDEIEVLSIEFQKIDTAFKVLGVAGSENQLPAVQFENDSLNLLKIIQASGGGDLDNKTEDLYAKINDGFDDFDQNIIKVQSDLITHRKAGKTQQEFLKMSEALLANINQVTDPNLKATLLGIEAQTLGVVDTLLKIDTGGGGDGGLT